MKVLAVNTVSTTRNGITGVIMNLHRAMDMSGIHIDLLSINEPEAHYIKQIEAVGGKVLVLKRSSAHPIRYIRRLAKLIRQNGYDAIHAHGNSATLALEMVAAWLGGCKVRIAHSHNTYTKHKMAHLLLKPLLYMLCTHRLSCGEAAGKWLYGKRQFTIVNNGVDTARFAFDPQQRQLVRQELGIPQGRRMIGHVGAFIESKNQRFLVEVLAQLTKDGQDYGLLLIGDGKQRSSVQALTVDLDLQDRVIFTGVTDQVAQHLCACDLFVLPSYYEGLPLVLVEAQANGLPCIVSDAVTREADKTGKLTFLPLSAGAEHWAQTICAKSNADEREAVSQKTVGKIADSGYDILAGAKALKQYYVKAMQKVRA